MQPTSDGCRAWPAEASLHVGAAAPASLYARAAQLLPPEHGWASQAPSLSLQPHLGDATTVVEGEVVGKVLHIWLPGTGDHHREQIHIVLLLSGVALKVGEDFLARLRVLGAPLLLCHGRDFGFIDMAAVARLVGRIRSVQRAVPFPGDGEGAYSHAFELALARRCLIGPILLDFQLRLHAGIFEISLHQLRRIDQVASIATADDELR